MKFKEPTLRNVEMTYPYFHDGADWTLEEAVDIMGKLQLDRTYSKDEIAKIVAFLKTLTGKQPDFKLPVLPPSTNDTPKLIAARSLTNGLLARPFYFSKSSTNSPGLSISFEYSIGYIVQGTLQ